MARQYARVEDCEVLYEDYSKLSTTLAEKFIQKASDWVNAMVLEFHPALSSALPTSGESPNFWIQTATANEAIYLALSRRMITSQEDDEGYWDSFHDDAMEILDALYNGKYKLDPDIKFGAKGIGMTEAIENESYNVGGNEWLESNANVPDTCYEDDVYSRTYYVELQTIGSDIKSSTFRYRTNMSETAWEQENLTMSYSFLSLGYGVEVRFLSDNFANFETGMLWRIKCYPERDSKQRATAISTVFWTRG